MEGCGREGKRIRGRRIGMIDALREGNSYDTFNWKAPDRVRFIVNAKY